MYSQISKILVCTPPLTGVKFANYISASVLKSICQLKVFDFLFTISTGTARLLCRKRRGYEGVMWGVRLLLSFGQS